MYNNFDAKLVDTRGGQKLGIEHTRDKMVGRGVLLDIARFKGVDSLDDGYPITNQDLDECAKKQGVEVRKGDFAPSVPDIRSVVWRRRTGQAMRGAMRRAGLRNRALDQE